MKGLEVEMEQLRELVGALVEVEDMGCASGSSSPQTGRRLRGGKVTGQNKTGQKETGC